MKYINILVFLLLCVTFVKSSDLESRKVHLVDYYQLPNGNTNYFFRGNEPKKTLSNGINKSNYSTAILAYDDLVEYMRNNSQTVYGITLPDQFYIIDIKLVTGPLPSELKDVELEQNFFAAEPQLGEFHMNQTFGDIIDPQFVSKDNLEKYATSLPTWSKDNLPLRMRDYHNILITQRDLPVVLYVHCECGCDRTGEVMASYVMRFKGWNLEKALEWDFQIAGRVINFANRWAAQWYCLYLYYVEKFDIDCNPPPL
ncbi:hypothetical protein DICPUDRAFT_155043 [Dictyostelium purpureum]|uniref:Tyrosine specific protein phosphatases domain-containing protein n=1 Tax=Dictyostelium purpureum TaxID=5786 RepID=F0ZSX7_DICPU|nr:uncharacterized protein DICPUDRAFT_155043 [Dictyostelium purpureum]EGC32956.1 hypothetical protein DICPUDRAFT_155043 [Dictyostelium purpureum]|eukprot:XP_003290522.1 hypothetical protein DICPUDRAFT_155043 [Dictyostelium purpureum]